MLIVLLMLFVPRERVSYQVRKLDSTVLQPAKADEFSFMLPWGSGGCKGRASLAPD